MTFSPRIVWTRSLVAAALIGGCFFAGCGGRPDQEVIQRPIDDSVPTDTDGVPLEE